MTGNTTQAMAKVNARQPTITAKRLVPLAIATIKTTAIKLPITMIVLWLCFLSFGAGVIGGGNHRAGIFACLMPNLFALF